MTTTTKPKLLSFSDLPAHLRTKIKNCYRWNYSIDNQKCSICKRRKFCELLEENQ